MSTSQVFYRWGAGRDESRVTFTGTLISVFDFKRQVMLDNNLGNGKEFDLVAFENGEELKDDNHQIARSSSLVVRRRPAIRKGAGNAQNYIVGTDASVSLTGEHRIEAHAKKQMTEKALGLRGAAGTYGSLSKRFDGKEEEAAPKISTGNAEEDAGIQAMLQQQADFMESNLDDISAQPRFQGASRGRGTGRGGFSGRPGANTFNASMAPDGEPPVGYICYRCGQKGHWIQNCPQNEEGGQEQKRYNRVTGIPRRFLETVASPAEGEGSSGGAMLTADGGFVQARPDTREWQKVAAIKVAVEDDDSKNKLDPELTCPICKKIVTDAVRVPCCKSSYCEECIQSYLLEHDFECPSCESKIASLAKLEADDELREKAKAHKEEVRVKKEEEDKDKEGQAEEAEEGEEGEKKPEDDVAGKNPFSGPLPDINTMGEYLNSMMMTLRNPLVPPNVKAELRRTHIKMATKNFMTMQLLAAQGMMAGMAGMMGQQGMPGMNNQMGMNQGMIVNPMTQMGGGMGMNQMGNQMGNQNMMNQGMPGMGNGFNQNGPNIGNNGFPVNANVAMRGGGRGGRGGRGGFRGRGGGGFSQGGGGFGGPRGMKRGPDEFEQRA